MNVEVSSHTTASRDSLLGFGIFSVHALILPANTKDVSNVLLKIFLCLDLVLDFQFFSEYIKYKVFSVS